MVRDGYRKGRLYSYLACISLMTSALLASQLAVAAELVNIEPGSAAAVTSAAAEEYSSVLAANATWLAASGDGSVVAGMSELFSSAEARSRLFIADQDRRIRSELSGWFTPKSSIAIAANQAKSLLSNRDGGLSVGVGIDELSVDWTVRF